MIPANTTDWTTPDGATLHDLVFGDPDAPPDRTLVIVCGAFLPALIYAPFATALARDLEGSWAVHVYDRRGKGKSSPVDESYTFATELADVRTALAASGAKHLLGHSLGGAIALHAVRALADSGDLLVPDSTIVYDPAINLDGSFDTAWLPRFQEYATRSQWGRAAAVVERVMGRSHTLSKAPSWMVAGVMAVCVRTGLRGMSQAIFPAGAAELSAAFTEEARGSDFADMPSNVCLLIGERSADYFHATAVALDRAMPDAQLVTVRRGIHGSVPAVRHPIVTAASRWLRGEALGAIAR